MQFDFLAQRHVDTEALLERVINEKLAAPFVAFALVMLAAFAVAQLERHTLQNNETALTVYRDQLASLDLAVKRARLSNARTRQLEKTALRVAAMFDSGRAAAVTVSRIADRLPDRVALRSFSLSGSRIEIGGLAAGFDEIAKAMSSLEDDGEEERVVLISARADDDKTRSGTAFSLQMEPR